MVPDPDQSGNDVSAPFGPDLDEVEGYTYGNYFVIRHEGDAQAWIRSDTVVEPPA
jgi:hypothetical protein